MAQAQEAAAQIESEGSAGVWPVAALTGALAAIAPALLAWIAGALEGRPHPVALPSWIAEHALWGTAFGALAAAVLALLARSLPELRDEEKRRAHACLFAFALASALPLAPAMLAAFDGSLRLGGAIALTLAAAFWVSALPRVRAGRLPRLDPIRGAVILALLTLPLTADIHPQRFSLISVWRAMLGG